MSGKLTKEDTGKKVIVIRTFGDADVTGLEKVLLQCGYSCVESSPRRAGTDAVWLNGAHYFWFNFSHSSFPECTHVTTGQFIAALDETLLYSAGEKALHARFNELSERVEKLTAMVEKLCAEILPKNDINKEKPGLKS